jgi:adenine-specific DNA methylase/very-short-patch-repair endonuclease
MTTRKQVFIEKIMPVKLLNEQVYYEHGGNPFKGLHRWYSRKPLSFSRASVLASLLPVDVTMEEFEYLLGLNRRLPPIPLNKGGAEGGGIKIQNYLWAHTVVCPSCESVVPLSPNWWLSKTSNYAGKGQARKVTSDWYAVKPIPNLKEKCVDFELVRGKKGKIGIVPSDPPQPPLARGEQEVLLKVPLDKGDLGGSEYNPDEYTTIARGVGKCSNCGNVIGDDVIKSQAQAGNFGQQLYAVAYREGKSSLDFRIPTRVDIDGVSKAEAYLNEKLDYFQASGLLPDVDISVGAKTDELLRYGIDDWSKLFNPRQLLTLITYVEIINEAKELMRAEYEPKMVEAIATYLALVCDRCVDANCRLAHWHSSRGYAEIASGQHSLNLMWNYPEVSGNGELWKSCADVFISDYQNLCNLIGASSGELFRSPPAPLDKGGAREALESPPYQGGFRGIDLPRIGEVQGEFRRIDLTVIAKERNLSYSEGHLPYNPKLVDRAKELRKNLTEAEKKLWQEFLRTFEHRVLRQRPIDHFIVDFYCHTLKLVIEVDGDSHFTEEGKDYDGERTEILQRYGLHVLRFTNHEVLNNFEAVCQTIANFDPSNSNSNFPLDNSDSNSPLNKGGWGGSEHPSSYEIDPPKSPLSRETSKQNSSSDSPLVKGGWGGSILSASADNLSHILDKSIDAIVTDPPYYATIQYAELSDFFYVWMKRNLGDIFPDLFWMELTDKEREAVSNPYRFRNMGTSPEELANQDYEAKMAMAFAEYHRVLRDDGVMTVQFNHKESGAWDVLAKSLIDAGFEITASWAVSTENPQNLHQAQKNSVASTVLLVCRKRDPNAGQAWWDDLRPEVANLVEQRAPEFESNDITGIDLYLSAFGPALNVFSRNYPILDSAGTEVRPEVAFAEARKAVANYRFRKLAQTDTAGFDPLTQWYFLAWDAFRAREFPFDDARQLALAVGGFNVADLGKTYKLLDVKSGTCKFLSPDQRFKKRAFSLSDSEFSARYLVDGLHAIIALYLEEQTIEPVRRFMKATGLIGNEMFMRSWEVALKVIPHIGDPRKRIPEEKALADLWLAMDEIKAKVTYVQPELDFTSGQMGLDFDPTEEEE